MSAPTTTVQNARLLVTPDGRRLAFYDVGDPDGVPCIYTTGTPASGLAGAVYHQAAAAAGVRWISPDKPGYGLSDFHPGRTLQDWAADVSLIADHLGLDTFAAAGESGGGPHVLALARFLPERVTTAIVLAGMGPSTEPEVVAQMKPTNRRLMTLALRAPWAMRIAMAPMTRAVKTEKGRARLLAKLMAEASAPDRELWHSRPDLLPFMGEASALAFRDGGAGAAQEMALFARPWGFDLADITVPVVIWHGEEDLNVPVAIARHVAETVPNSTAHILPGMGHGVAMHHMDDIMKSVVDAAG